MMTIDKEQHMICDECETVAHCLMNGCVPKQPATEESSAVQPAPVQELVCVCGAVWEGQELVEAPAAQPVVPDAIHHADMAETLEYIQGWNDCRALMLNWRKGQ